MLSIKLVQLRNICVTGPTGTVTSSSSIMFSIASGLIMTHVSAGDHIQYNEVTFSRRSDITLDITTTYTNTIGAARISSFTLASNKTYRLTVCLRDTSL